MSEQFSTEHIAKAVEKLIEEPKQSIADDLKAYFIQMLQNADFVRVVRCKDCKNSVCIGERYFCDIQYDEWGQPYVVKPDGFCDVGERRESE